MMNQTQPGKRHRGAPALALAALARLTACAVSGLLGYAGIVSATPAFAFASTPVGPTLFDEIDVKTRTGTHKVKIDTRGSSDVYIVTNVVKSGGHSGWHTHPGPSLVTVQSGTATYYDGDDPTCTPHVVQAGEGFVDEGGGHVHLIQNQGVVDLQLIAFQIIPEHATRRIDSPAPSPSNCPLF
jgi:quercetin dioxygenase-like cupin family protein